MLQIPLLKGRYFTEQDSKGSIPVAIINESLAQRYFPGKDPVGKTLNIGLWEFEDIERREIVGVVANARQNVVRPPLPAVYYPYSQLPAVFRFGYGGEHLFATFLVRSAIDPSNFKIVMKQAALGVARDIMVEEAQTVADLRSRSTRYPRFYTWLLATFAGTALVLASVGLFGVVSYSVTQRTHEVGIRMALGAQAGHVLQLILRSGFLMTSIGMILGLGSTLGLARFLQAWIFEAGMSEVKPTEPAVLLAVSLFFAFVSFLASYIPARRATKLDPMVTLRHE
jgi:putative ABC transport system permease protein